MIPRTICCWLNSSPRISMPLLIMPISSEPTSAPITEPAAAEEAGPAEYDRGDDRQLVALAPLEPAGLQPPGVEHARERRHHRGDEHDRER